VRLVIAARLLPAFLRSGWTMRFADAALTLIEMYGDHAAEVAREQAEASDQIGDGRRAECWRRIADAIEQRRSIH
jgi:hypothetical protein